MTDGVTPDVVHDERLSHVVVSIAVVKPPDVERVKRRYDINIAVGVHSEWIQRTIGDFIQSVTIGIGSLELETAIHGMRGSQRNAIVIGVPDVLCLGNHSKSRVRLGSRQRSEWEARRTESVQSWIRDLFMFAMIAHILSAQRGVPAQGVLYFQVPLVIPRNLHRARIEEVERRHSVAVDKIGAESGIGRYRLPIQASRSRGRERAIE